MTMEVRNIGKLLRTEMGRVDVFILALIVTASAFMFKRLVPAEPFGYDEADYMYVASKGFVSSYLDRPSVSLVEFVRRGIESGLHSDKWRGLSAYTRQRNDITLYRHFHGPLFFYGLGFMQDLYGPGESVVRWTSFLSLMLTTLIVYIGSFALAGKRGRFVAVLAVGFLLLSPTNVEAARWALPHNLYSAFAMATLFLAAKLVQTKDLRFLYGALLSLSLAFLTIEYAPLLAIVLVVTVFVNRRGLFQGFSTTDLLRLSLRCAVIPLIVVGVLWPAGVYKLSLVKTYVFFSYIATMRNQAYGTNPLSYVWWTRVTSSPLEYLLLLSLTCYLFYAFVRRHELFYLQPFLIYAPLMFFTTVRNHSEAAIHVLSLISCLGIISAFAISLILKDAQPKLRGTIAVSILLGLAINNFWFYYRIETKRPADERLTAVVDILRASRVRGQRILVSQNYVPTIHYYFQGADLTGYTEGTGVQEVSRRIMDGNFYDLVYEGDNYEGLRSLLEKSWSVRLVTKCESDKPGRAVVYYHLSRPGPLPTEAAPHTRPGAKTITGIGSCCRFGVADCVYDWEPNRLALPMLLRPRVGAEDFGRADNPLIS